MTVHFIGIDPDTDTGQCPAVFVDDESGDFLFQGDLITDAATLANVATHSPIATHEAVVRLPARMRTIIREAIDASHGAAV
jgi:hypothetical protein